MRGGTGRPELDGMTGWRRTLFGLVSGFVRRAPFERGKGPLQRIALRSLGLSTVVVHVPEGFRMALRFPEDFGWERVLFHGIYEPSTTNLLKRLVRPGSVVIDVGANLGWFSLLAVGTCGARECHAFEPVPEIFERLDGNRRLNDAADRITVNPVALGGEEGECEVFTFEGLPHGHSSVSTQGRSEYTVSTVPVVRLDRYVEESGMPPPDLVKLDAEGAELDVLRGATGLLESERPPMWIIEMDRPTAEAVGQRPEDRLNLLRQYQDYTVYRPIDSFGNVHLMEDPTCYQNGDNVLCIPPGRRSEIEPLILPRVGPEASR